MPPARRTSSGDQCPATNSGSSHSITATRGRGARAALSVSCTRRMRASSEASSASASARRPIAAPTRRTSSHTPSSVVPPSVTTDGATSSAAIARSTSLSGSAHTSHSDWVSTTSGASVAKRPRRAEHRRAGRRQRAHLGVDVGRRRVAIHRARRHPRQSRDLARMSRTRASRRRADRTRRGRRRSRWRRGEARRRAAPARRASVVTPDREGGERRQQDGEPGRVPADVFGEAVVHDPEAGEHLPEQPRDHALGDPDAARRRSAMLLCQKRMSAICTSAYSHVITPTTRSLCASAQSARLRTERVIDLHDEAGEQRQAEQDVPYLRLAVRREPLVARHLLRRPDVDFRCPASAVPSSHPGSRDHTTTVPHVALRVANCGGVVAGLAYSSIASTFSGEISSADPRSSGMPSIQYCGGQSRDRADPRAAETDLLAAPVLHDRHARTPSARRRRTGSRPSARSRLA